MVLLKRAGEDKEIPQVVDFYNQHMGGVDKKDQMLTSYKIERKRVNQCSYHAYAFRWQW